MGIHGRTPHLALPPLSCDAHCHVFGPAAVFPYAPDRRYTPEDAPKEVVLLEVLDQTAAAKVIAWWGTDYLHLAKYEGQWKIIHVLWQTPPQN